MMWITAAASKVVVLVVVGPFMVQRYFQVVGSALPMTVHDDTGVSDMRPLRMSI